VLLTFNSNVLKSSWVPDGEGISANLSVSVPYAELRC